MANMKKAAVSGKTVKTTTYSPLNPFKKDVKMVNERTTRKPVAKPTAKPKTTTKAPAVKKPAVKRPNVKPAPLPKKPKPLTGPAAVEAIQRRTSPSGVKKAESGAKKGIDKKYPGLYKKSK